MNSSNWLIPPRRTSSVCRRRCAMLHAAEGTSWLTFSKQPFYGAYVFRATKCYGPIPDDSSVLCQGISYCTSIVEPHRVHLARRDTTIGKISLWTAFLRRADIDGSREIIPAFQDTQKPTSISPSWEPNLSGGVLQACQIGDCRRLLST